MLIKSARDRECESGATLLQLVAKWRNNQVSRNRWKINIDIYIFEVEKIIFSNPHLSFSIYIIHMLYFIFSIDFIFFNCNFSLRRILSIRFVWNFWINTPKCWLIKLKILFKLFYMTPSMGHWLVGYFFYLFWCLKWWIMTNL